MAAKKKEDIPLTNSNVNNNVNNINVHVTAPKILRKRTIKKEERPNWLFKAIVVALIALILPFIWNYIKDVLDGGHGKPPVIYSKPIQGQKVL